MLPVVQWCESHSLLSVPQASGPGALRVSVGAAFSVPGRVYPAK